MTCPKCGKKNTDNVNRCRYCGYVMSPDDIPSRKLQNRRIRRRKKRLRALRKTIIAFLAVAAVITACIVFIPPVNRFFTGRVLAGRSSGENDEQTIHVECPDGKQITYHRSDASHIAADEILGVSFIDNELILSFDDTVASDAVQAAVSPYGGTIVGVNDFLNSYQILFDREYTYDELLGVQDEIVSKLPGADAAPNYYLKIGLAEYTPNDREWIHEWGDEPAGKNWGVEAIHAPDMWEYYMPMDKSTVNVGVLDNQFYADHEDLDFKETFLNSYVFFEEKSHHGTHVSGIIAATFNNNLGIAGIARYANLYGASYIGIGYNPSEYDFDGTTCCTICSIESGLTYLIAAKQCKVINLSIVWGADNLKESDYDQAGHMERQLRKLIDKGFDFLIVKASGNDRKDYESGNLFAAITDPLVLSRMIIVGAAELGDCGDGNPYHVWRKSNFGSAVDLIAPGADIYSTVPPTGLFGRLYDNHSGTSMAAPHVTGTAAAIWSAFPELTAVQIKQVLCSTAQGSYGYAEEISDRYPMLDAYAAIQKAAEIAQADSSVTEQTTPDWSAAYQNYVLNRKFLNYGDSTLGYGDLESGPALITFALHDMNGDAVPELIIFNGFNGRDLQANYVFTYTGTEVAYCGKTLAAAYAVDDYPGLFSSMTSTGSYLEEQYTGQYAEITYLDYHSLYGTTVTKESVSVTGLPISSSGRIIISRTANDAVYEAGQRAPHYLATVTWQELNTEGWDSFVRRYSGEVVEIPLQVGETSWSAAYESFVVEEEYLSTGLTFSSDENSQPHFSLCDLDRNGVPELLAFNGLGPMTGGNTYVFTCKDGQVQQVGSLHEGSGYPYRYEGSSYPGLFVNWGEGTSHQQLYFEMNGEQLVEMPVRIVAMTENQTHSSTPLTDNQDLYNYAVSCEESGLNRALPFFGLSEIRTMGWDAFVQAESSYGLLQESDSEEITIGYSGYTTQFGPKELSVDSSAGIYENKNLSVLCAMLSDAAYSDGGTQLALLYRDMFDGTYCDLRFDYSDQNFCSGIALGEKVINGERINVLVITIKGTEVRLDISSLDVDFSELFTDIDSSRTEYKSYLAYSAIVEFEQRILSQVNELLANNIDRMDLSRPLKIIITGHSLGGAAANLIGATYTDGCTSGSGWWSELAGCEDIYCYTFAAINALDSADPGISFPISDGYENIHNIINSYDGVVAGANITRGHSISDGKFGHNDWIEKDYSDDTLENHQMYRYLESVDCDLVSEK